MIAASFVDDVGLALTRLSTLFVTSWGLFILVRALFRHRNHSTRVIIPVPIMLFTVFWMSILWTFAFVLLVTEAAGVSSGLWRVLYGMSFVWTIAGLVWIIVIAKQSVEAAREIVRIAEEEVRKLAR